MNTPTITWTGHLVIGVNKKGKKVSQCHYWGKTARLTATPPRLGKDEVAVKITVELPVTLFEEPQLEARITVPADSVTPQVIDLAVVRDAIEQSTGFSVSVVQKEGES